MSGMISNLRSVSSLILLFSFFLFFCREVVREQKSISSFDLREPHLKVKVLETEDDVLISPEGSFSIKCISEDSEDAFYYSSASLIVKSSGGGLVLCQRRGEIVEKNLSRILFVPQERRFWLYLNDRGYRGMLEIRTNQSEGFISVLNLVYIEDYLKGVVPAEMGNQGLAELEALKAQAIASRSYALFKTARNSENEYHLESTILDQLYGGMEIENPVVNLAVEKTSGEVIIENGNIIKAYYHACCGGSTENVEEVWNEQKESYLKRVDDMDYCGWYKKFRWERMWRREELERVLSFSLKDFFEVSDDGIGKLVDLQIMDRTLSGRVRELCIGTESETYHVLKDNIRWFLRDPSDSTRILPSTFFELELVKNEKGEIEQIKTKGKGNGHGVGMCQTGAIGMARRGFSYQQILKHYYAGVEIEKIY